MSLSDTIVASATAPGRGAISIIRLSGGNSLRIADALAGKTLTPRLATFGKLISDGLLIDTGVWIYFKGPNSFTGEEGVFHAKVVDPQNKWCLSEFDRF